MAHSFLAAARAKKPSSLFSFKYSRRKVVHECF